MEASKERLEKLLGGGAAERRQGYAMLLACSAEMPGIGRWAVPHLCAVLTHRDASDVGASEFRRAAAVLCELLVHSRGVCGELARTFARAGPDMLHPAVDTMLTNFLAKEEATITEADITMMAPFFNCFCHIFAYGITAGLLELGEPEMATGDTEVAVMIQSVVLSPFGVSKADDKLGQIVLNPDRKSDAFSLAVIRLGLKMLSSGTLSGTDRSGVWGIIILSAHSRPKVARAMFEESSTFIDTAVKELRTAGPAEWLSFQDCFSRCDGMTFHALLGAVKDAAEQSQAAGFDPIPILLRSGFWQIAADLLNFFESLKKTHDISDPSAGDTNVMAFFYGTAWFLSAIDFYAHPEAVATLVDGVTPAAWTYVIENDVAQFEYTGITTAGFLSMVCSSLFGKDEHGPVRFKREHIHQSLMMVQELLRPRAWGMTWVLPRCAPQAIMSLCVSDENKRLLLQSEAFIPLLIDGLWLDEPHPSRAGTAHAIKAKMQSDLAECIWQIALFPPGCKALKAASGGVVVKALHQLLDCAFTHEAKENAKGALMILESAAEGEAGGRDTDSQQTRSAADEIEHVMLSYNWGHQDVIKRVNLGLKERGYTVWIDIEKMKGNAVEKMAEAIEAAAVVVYGVSQAYKESPNCRLEAQYALQREKAMVPILLEEGYRADGWLGMLIGTRIWYAFCGSTLSSHSAFEDKLEDLSRELGEQGRALLPAVVPEGLPPTSTSQAVDAAEFSPSMRASPSPSPIRRRDSTSLPLSAAAGGGGSARASTSVPSHASQPPRPSRPPASQPQPAHEQGLLPLGETTSFVKEVAALVRDERQVLEAKMESQQEAAKQELKAQIAAVEARLRPLPRLSQASVQALQARLERMHAAKLLQDDELYSLQDCVVDYVELYLGLLLPFPARPTDAEMEVASKTFKLAGLSEAIASDVTFARQCRRKYV